MIAFEIEPFVGPNPIRFGMTPAEVEGIIGPPDQLLPDFFGNRSEMRKCLSLGYRESDDRLIEAVFAPGISLSFRGQELFATTDLIDFLRTFDPKPQLLVGFVIFLELGMQLSGFHDNDESQKAISVVAKGLWDDDLDGCVPYP